MNITGYCGRSGRGVCCFDKSFSDRDMERVSCGYESGGRLCVFVVGGGYYRGEPGSLFLTAVWCRSWFFGEQKEQSLVEIKLKKENGKTLLELRHAHIPDEVYDEITEGWREYYLGSMKEMLEIY